MLALKQVNKAFGSRQIIRNLDLSIEEGSILCIVGPSGGGKTTLLRILAGLETYDSGEFLLDGQPFNPSTSKEQVVGVVFQDFQLFPHLSVMENITLAPKLALKQSAAESQQMAQNLAQRLGLSQLLNHYPYQLSGGQKQRVAIARAMAMNPKVLAYDEPTSALDPGLSKQVADLILEMKEAGMTQIVVTHDLEFAKRIADQLYQVTPVE
ncbi:amino acid ABC transporter ATP-binding protein [Enterococcus cecorum]|uniref:amino acid ABC transporter ATP-binding protein n=1 Tax=Enterococcus cecorum TaxID=44008 RepID=UPI00148B7A90|nr:amino acid ABC transporter ATP-binding protein [Enterococcus cecorum]CAI3331634.1 amino acid ABC transporter ATP-binding protein [Enterococcus cecorum]CAI3454693.1 amino acid ABC transporter ATP-binding protein [Enterococcus cecorum]